MRSKNSYFDLFKINDLESKFIRKIILGENGCWIWCGSPDGSGYGTFITKGVAYRAHRVSMLIFRNECFDNKTLCLHHCDNPICVNPLHLYWGNQTDNMQDRLDRGRDSYANKTHCKHGHPFKGDNLAWDLRTGTKRKRRRCKQCKKKSSRNFHLKNILKNTLIKAA